MASGENGRKAWQSQFRRKLSPVQFDSQNRKIGPFLQFLASDRISQHFRLWAERQRRVKKSKFRLIRKMPERGRTNSRCAARTLSAPYFGHKICDNSALCLPLIGANSLRVNIQGNSGAGVAKEFLHHFDPFSVPMQRGR
jgi:hypothetical protein